MNESGIRIKGEDGEKNSASASASGVLRVLVHEKKIKYVVAPSGTPELEMCHESLYQYIDTKLPSTFSWTVALLQSISAAESSPWLKNFL